MQVEKAQRKQKWQHDRHAWDPRFNVGDRVFVYMPVEFLEKAYKFARPFKGPYRILTMFDSGAEVKLIEKLQADAIRVALNHVQRCPCEISSSNRPDAGEESNDGEESEPVSPGPIQPEPVTGEPVLLIKPTSPQSE